MLNEISKFNPTKLERDLYEERAAIIEFEGNETRETAEREAFKEFWLNRKKLKNKNKEA